MIVEVIVLLCLIIGSLLAIFQSSLSCVDNFLFQSKFSC